MAWLEGSDQARVILDALPDAAMLVVAPDPTLAPEIQLANVHAAELFGYPPSELAGRSFDDIVDARDRARAKAALASGQGIEDLVCMRKDGSELEAQVCVNAVAPAPSRQSVVVVRPGLAVTQAFATLLASVPDGMVVVRFDGRITLVNRRMEELFGYCPGELLGRPVEMLMPRRYAAQHVVLREGYRRHPAVRLMQAGGREMVGRRKDGSEFPVDIMLSPVKTEAGTMTVAAVRDATDREKLQQARVQLAASEEAVRLRDEFVALVAHELRTPLTALRLNLARVARAPGELRTDAERPGVERMSSALRRIEGLVEELLDTSQLIGAKPTLECTDVDLGALVREETEAFAEQLERGGCCLTFLSPEPVVGVWDRTRLRQAIGHLLSNAIKYGRGSPIDVHVDRVGDEAVLTVRDHGIGVAAEHRTKVFERFARFVSSEHYAGLGIGLWIVRLIAEAHGGRVSMSGDGDGATFRIQLPVAPLQHADATA